MIHRKVALVTARSRKSVTTFRQAAMYAAAVPLLRLSFASGSWLNVNRTGTPYALILSAQATSWVCRVLPGVASAMACQDTSESVVRWARSEISGVRPVWASQVWYEVGKVASQSRNTRTAPNERPTLVSRPCTSDLLLTPPRPHTFGAAAAPAGPAPVPVSAGSPAPRSAAATATATNRLLAPTTNSPQ